MSCKVSNSDFQLSYAQPLSVMYCFSDKAEMLFPNTHPQNPVDMAAGDHPQESLAVVDDADIDVAENDDNYVDGRFALLYV